ncbi:FAS1-like dehydratase domain-containing protein [Ferroacidibacillus organovorans]|uniref:Dehydratase n=1 Tax=Ferroacidibacillus organovorans TaxID=1765683 RepID=A0A101XNK8_9BACL|nr:MaoC family dehydratase N-terminal domain-containing protein [Ferroacidibacillus organovorans]KUO94703.1 dehydratase [Ferroacidibacillus organovorans]
MKLEEFRHFVGCSSRPVRNEIEKGAIRKFATAIGDFNPRYHDDSLRDDGRLLAPPTFSRTFEYGSIEGLSYAREGLIHGEQAFVYYQPLYSGETVFCRTTLRDAYERSGTLGAMIFLVYGQEVRRADGELLEASTSVIIFRDKEGV